VDPAFAPRASESAVEPSVEDAGWGVAQAPSFAPEAPATNDPFASASEAPVAQVPAPPVVSETAASELTAMAEPEPVAAPDPVPMPEQLASVIPMNLDGMWVAGRSRIAGGRSNEPRAPKERSKGLRLRRSRNEAGLEAVASQAAQEDPAAFAPVPPAAVPEAEPKPKRGGLSKEIRFGRRKKEAAASGEGGFAAAPPASTGFGAPVPASGAGFGSVAPVPPIPPPPPPAGAAGNAGFGPEPSVDQESGFGPAQASGDAWREPIPAKKRRGLRLPSSSGKPGRPMMAVLLVFVLVAGALGYQFFLRGGGGAKPAFALDMAAGQTYTYQMTLGLDGNLRLAGRAIPFKERFGATMVWNVQSVDASGVATVDVRISDPRATLNGQTISGSQFPTGSMHSTMRIAKDGSILSGGGIGGLGGGASSAAASDVPGTDQLTPVLPGHDVQVGATWDKTFDADIPYGMGHVHYVTHSTYVRNEDVNGVSAAVIASKLSLPVHMKLDLQKMLLAMGTGQSGLPAGSHPVIFYRGKVTGSTTGWFDPKARQLLKTSLQAQFSLRMRFTGLPPGSLPGGNEMGFTGAMAINLVRS